MKKTAKLFMTFCMAGALCGAGAFPVLAQENVDVETLERQEQEAEGTVSEEQSEGFSFKDAEGLEFVFSSGAGAWGTVMTIRGDGTFEGNFHDSNMGDIGEGYPNGSMYMCDFSGKFKELEKVNDYTYSTEIETISYQQVPDTTEIVDGIRLIYTDSRGLGKAERILFYTAGAPIAELPEDYRSWAGYHDLTAVQETALPFIGIYNEVQGVGFYSYKKETVESSSSTIDAELAEIEARAAEIDGKANDPYADQATINMAAQELYTLWDDELNSIWTRIKEKLPAEEFDALTQVQLDWIAEKEASIAAALAELGGGSMSASVEFGRGASITKERVYELAEYLR